MNRIDLVSPEIRSVEREIDTEYRSCALFQESFSEAAWYFLAHCEEVCLRDYSQSQERGLQYTACVVDNIVNNAKWPLRWMRNDCRAGSRIPLYSPNHYGAAWQLYELSDNYTCFESAFKYASVGQIQLSLDENCIRVTKELRAESRYEAYDRLAKPGEPAEQAIQSLDAELIGAINDSVRISGSKYECRLNPKLVVAVMDTLNFLFSESIILPSDWTFPRFSISEFGLVTRALQALAFIHTQARHVASNMGCKGAGYDSSVLVMEGEELENRVRRYTRIELPVVRSILQTLTFGAARQDNPDPALQPLIALTPDKIAITPSLILGNDSRRNFATLLNRMATEKKLYSQLNTEREEKCQSRIASKCKVLGYRTWSGNWPGRPDLPDIDIVIISDDEKHCLFLEVKAYIEPAEAREILERDEEITKGISQALKLRDAFRNDPKTIQAVLNAEDYTATFAVTSESGIGSHAVQNELVPVVRTSHISDVLAKSELRNVCDWLERREYLPVLGTHYEVRDVLAQVGKWKLEWYGILPLVADTYW